MKVLSKVKSVQSNGSFENQYGAEQPDGKKLLFSFEYEFEDGIVMGANHKTNISPFQEGSEVEYEITRKNEYGKSGTVSKPQEAFQPNQTGNQKSDKVQVYIIKQSSLTRAIEHLSYNSQAMIKEDVIALAGYYTNWVLKDLQTIEKAPANTVPVEAPVEDYRNDKYDDMDIGDLPY